VRAVPTVIREVCFSVAAVRTGAEGVIFATTVVELA
jgi:hypothetical protein